MSLVRQTSHGTWPRRLLVLRRAPGYLRMHVPQLLYAPSLQPKLTAVLASIPGVRRIVCDRHRARLAIFYDGLAASERALLLAVRDVAAPYLERMEPEPFAIALAEQQQARAERLTGKAAQGTYLTLLGWAHWHVLRWAIRRPLAAWWVWALLAFALYTHRRQIRRIPELS